MFDEWKKSNPAKDEIIELANFGISRFQDKHDKEEDPDKKKMYADHLAGAKMAVETFESPQAVFEKCVDSMSDYLDSKKVRNYKFLK